MRRLAVFSMVATVATLGLVGALSPVLAIDTSSVDGCEMTDDGSRAVIATPPGALVLNFAPDCVTIRNGGTVHIQGIDADPHIFLVPSSTGRAGSCLDTGLIATGMANQGTFNYDLVESTLTATELISTPNGGVPNGALNEARECDTEAITKIGPNNPIGGNTPFLHPVPQDTYVPVVDTSTPGEVVINYICGFHGPVMHGKIRIIL